MTLESGKYLHSLVANALMGRLALAAPFAFTLATFDILKTTFHELPPPYGCQTNKT